MQTDREGPPRSLPDVEALVRQYKDEEAAGNDLLDDPSVHTTKPGFIERSKAALKEVLPPSIVGTLAIIGSGFAINQIQTNPSDMLPKKEPGISAPAGPGHEQLIEHAIAAATGTPVRQRQAPTTEAAQDQEAQIAAAVEETEDSLADVLDEAREAEEAAATGTATQKATSTGTATQEATATGTATQRATEEPEATSTPAATQTQEATAEPTDPPTETPEPTPTQTEVPQYAERLYKDYGIDLVSPRFFMDDPAYLESYNLDDIEAYENLRDLIAKTIIDMANNGYENVVQALQDATERIIVGLTRTDLNMAPTGTLSTYLIDVFEFDTGEYFGLELSTTEKKNPPSGLSQEDDAQLGLILGAVERYLMTDDGYAELDEWMANNPDFLNPDFLDTDDPKVQELLRILFEPHDSTGYVLSPAEIYARLKTLQIAGEDFTDILEEACGLGVVDCTNLGIAPDAAE